MDEEILQDFLVEAGEIIDRLDEQLVQIEKSPDDKDLLNAIFRAFHTVKGGAGFLELSELVDICHAAENVFDMLRNGHIKMSSVLMDAILQAFDEIRRLFTSVQNRETLVAAPQELIDRLHDIADGKITGDSASQEKEPTVVVEEKASEQEPEKEVVEEIKVEDKKEDTPEVNRDPYEDHSIDDITEEEFEALLDQLHGKGHAPGMDNDKALEGNGYGEDETDSDFNALLDNANKEAKKEENTAPELKVASEEEFNKAVEDAKKALEAPLASQQSATSASAQARSATSAQTGASRGTTPQAAAKGTEVETTVRVDTKVLDDIMNMVGELVLVRNRLLSIASHRSDQEMSKVIANLDVVTGDLQGAVMKTRMQPIKKVFGRFPRVVRDLARKLNKKIELKMEGEETELDKNLVDALADPMVHMIRNCCDHGVETPAERRAAGKNEIGNIILSASQQGDHILLCITDDGRGMDPEVLRQVAIRKGVIDEDTASRLSDEEALNLVFAPGFSTNKEVTDISGRGVGMDVVKTNISKLNGSVRVISKVNEGTTIEIKVPLTLAILPTLMVSISNRTFALPLTSVSEIFYLSLDSMRVVDGLNTIVIREKAVPLFFLKE